MRAEHFPFKLCVAFRGTEALSSGVLEDQAGSGTGSILPNRKT
jgi:hypothetical protein